MHGGYFVFPFYGRGRGFGGIAQPLCIGSKNVFMITNQVLYEDAQLWSGWG